MARARRWRALRLALCEYVLLVCMAVAVAVAAAAILVVVAAGLMLNVVLVRVCLHH